MSIFVLKIIAMLTMVIDHSRYIVPEFDNDITKIIGRISFVLFTFILSEGIWHTKDRKKYLKRLTLFAIVSQIPFMLFRTIVGRFVLLNILFTFAIPMIGIILIDKYNSKKMKVVIGLICILLGLIIPVDYGVYGVILVLAFYYSRKTKWFDISYIVINLCYYLDKFIEIKNFEILIPYIIGVLIGYVILKFYNGKLGKKIKFLYWFYPVHMLIIYFIYLIVNGGYLIGM